MASMEAFREYFSRHFLGKVKVRVRLPAMEKPLVSSIHRTVDTHPIRTRMQVVGSSFFSLKNLSCSHRGFRFPEQWVRVQGAKIAKYAPGEIRISSLPRLSLNPVVRSDKKHMTLFPQERTNRLQWQTVRPKKEGEMLLAWFGPIVEEAVVKLTLNKQQGTLLIWYNPQSRRFESKGLYLYRRLGVQEKMEWRWL